MLPGTLMTSVCPRTPAIPRESAAIGVLGAPARRIASPMPGTSKSTTVEVACGVTSRGPSPVPPVVITRSAPLATAATIASAIRSSLSGTTSGPDTSNRSRSRIRTSAGPLSSAILFADTRSLTVTTCALLTAPPVASTSLSGRRISRAGGRFRGRRPFRRPWSCRSRSGPRRRPQSALPSRRRSGP